MANTNEEVRLLTFNLGLLRFRACCCTIFESPPFVEDRLVPICEALAASDAHIIAVQEIYEPDHVDLLLETVKGTFPYHARYDNQRCWQFHSGLLFLSRFPITDSSVFKHAESSGLEQMFGCKSCLTMQVGTPLGDLFLANLHTTAGGGSDTESGDTDSARQSELEEAMQACQQAMQKGCKAMIVGDFNCGPEASVGNYEFMKRDYVDAVLPFVSEQMVTWDCNNPLNNMPVFADCPAQRIDHFFIHKEVQLKASSAQLKFSEATVPVADRAGQKRVCLSDHYGVQVSLVKSNN